MILTYLTKKHLRLTKLKINQYKNIKNISVSFSRNINAFTGKNGMGKTNILDAIHYLCLAKSNTNHIEKNNVMIGEEFFRIEGDFENNNYATDSIVAKVKPPSIKSIEKNNKPYNRLADHIGKFPLVIIAPQDKNDLLHHSKDRRKLIDRTLSQQDNNYLNAIVEYNKLLKHRNALLKNSSIGNINKKLFDVYDLKIAPLVSLIFEKRKDFVENLLPDFRSIYAEIAEIEELPNITYKSEFHDKDYLEEVRKKLDTDIILKRSTVGIHKDDLLFDLNGNKLKDYASQGQIKSFILSLKLAEFLYLKKNKDATPLVLLDDVFDKLDQFRVKKLVTLLFNDKFGQVFISDTDRDRVKKIFLDENIRFKIFEVSKGEIIDTYEE